MENELLKLIATQGAFAVLFTYLLFHVLKTSAQREERLMSFTQELTERLSTISQQLGLISERLSEVEKSVERLANR